MTTAVHEKPQVAQAYKELQSGPVDVARIEVRAQYRKTFNEKAHKELTDNVKKVGVLQHVLLRFNSTKNGYILIAGERRLRAAKAAGLAQIPGRVLDVNEVQAAEIQALENLHREDLGELEQARAFRTLIDAGKYTVKQMADRMDKSEAYVYRAVRLLELPKPVLDGIDSGELTAEHGHQLLRLPAEKREAFWQEWTEGYDYEDGRTTAKALKESIDSEVGTDLSSARFTKDKAYAGESACSLCPYNSGNQGMLFEGAQKGRCMNRPCFDKKTAQYEKDLTETLRAKHSPAAVVFYQHQVWKGIGVGGWSVQEQLTAKTKVRPDQALIVSRHDHEVWTAVKPKAQPQQQRPAAPVSKPQTPKEKFIAEQVEKGLAAAVTLALPKADEKSLVAYFRREWNTNAWMKAEVKKAGVDIDKMKVVDCLRGFFALEINNEGLGDEEVLAALGQPTLAKDLAKKAAAKWDAEHPAKK